MLELTSTTSATAVSRTLPQLDLPMRCLLSRQLMYYSVMLPGHQTLCKQHSWPSVCVNLAANHIRGILANPAGTTPLMAAVRAGHACAVDFLLKKGADPAIENDAGCSAIHLAQVVFHFLPFLKCASVRFVTFASNIGGLHKIPCRSPSAAILIPGMCKYRQLNRRSF